TLIINNLTGKIQFCHLLKILLSSCVSNEDENLLDILQFEQNYIEKPLIKSEQFIPITGITENCTVLIENKEILDAYIENKQLYIITKNKGISHLTIKRGDIKATVLIKVIDPYLSLKVSAPIPSNSIFSKSDHLFFFANDIKSFYLSDNIFTIKNQGSYDISTQKNKTYIYLYYNNTEYTYDISSNPESVIRYLTNFSTKTLSNTISRSSNPKTIKAIDINSFEIYYFILENIEFPPYIYN
ncbi:MAG: hypothetical protein NC453_22920, partial [Muribaculum sp.]|nr:hypothetical protein [Muribaculum sp.]